MSTILYIPAPDDPHGVLAPGRHGARVPLFAEMHSFAHGPVVGWYPCGGGEPPHWRRALLLSDSDDSPEPIGMGRAREALVLALGGSVEEGSAWHRSGRGYYELWALWPNQPIPGSTSFRGRNFLPHNDVHDADPRNCTTLNLPAPYLAIDPKSLAPMAIVDHARALALTLAARIGGAIAVVE
jgi:hypothetical protein